MDFNWSKKPLAIQQTARQFVHDRLLPEYQNNDNKHAFDERMRKQLGELGLIYAELSEAYSGSDLGYLVRLILGDITCALYNIVYVQILACLNGGIIGKFAASHITNSWIPIMITGEKFGRDVMPYVSLINVRK